MLGMLKRKKSERSSNVDDLKAKLEDTDMRLALLKAELSAQMIKLAGQTSDLAPLSQAEEALSAAREYYNFENTPVEICLVQVALGDMLLKLGREKSEKPALVRAKTAYRLAITLASMHGDDALRKTLREKVRLVETLLGHKPKTPSLFRAA